MNSLLAAVAMTVSIGMSAPDHAYSYIAAEHAANPAAKQTLRLFASGINRMAQSNGNRFAIHRAAMEITKAERCAKASNVNLSRDELNRVMFMVLYSMQMHEGYRHNANLYTGMDKSDLPSRPDDRWTDACPSWTPKIIVRRKNEPKYVPANLAKSGNAFKSVAQKPVTAAIVPNSGEVPPPNFFKTTIRPAKTWEELEANRSPEQLVAQKTSENLHDEFVRLTEQRFEREAASEKKPEPQPAVQQAAAPTTDAAPQPAPEKLDQEFVHPKDFPKEPKKKAAPKTVKQPSVAVASVEPEFKDVEVITAPIQVAQADEDSHEPIVDIPELYDSPNYSGPAELSRPRVARTQRVNHAPAAIPAELQSLAPFIKSVNGR